MIRCLALVLLALLIAAPAQAHKASDAYLTLEPTGERIQGQWDIGLRDLEQAIGLDADGDGAITWGELRQRHAAIRAYALERLELAADGAPCPARPLDQLVADHGDGAYAVLRFDARCPAPPRELRVAYHLLADIDPLHRGLLRVATGDATHTAVLGPESPELRLPVSAPPDLLGQALSFGRQGVRHIWMGFDHVLFLLSLLLPAVLRREDGAWRAVQHPKEAAIEVLKVVTAFTLAHSVTLTLGTLGLVALPSRLVESLIAASIVLAAANNVWPIVRRRAWLVAFAFGLVHGLGFATALQELGLPHQALAVSLLAFNLGVELGQLAIVAAVLPPILSLRHAAFYPAVVLRFGSSAIAVLAGWWLVQRAFDVVLL